jgi:hypothetical protein
MGATLRISKLDAAKRQLEAAITLYFNSGDWVSIHALSGAAYMIIRDVNEHRCDELMLKDLWQYLDTPEAREFKKRSNWAENFLKHADRDPDGIYELDPEWTQAQMYEASAKFIQLTGEWAARMTLYSLVRPRASAHIP